MGDRVNITKETNKDGTESTSYSKSWQNNGLEHRKEIKKVEGGYIITESKYGKPKDGGDDAEYIDERKEYVTTKNPLDESEDKDEDEKLFSFVDTPIF